MSLRARLFLPAVTVAVLGYAADVALSLTGALKGNVSVVMGCILLPSIFLSAWSYGAYRAETDKGR